tara:strand:+ start:2155 stop:2304 length:150 start_codon:yes stop_codon:yes gene_type:complete
MEVEREELRCEVSTASETYLAAGTVVPVPRGAWLALEGTAARDEQRKDG